MGVPAEAGQDAELSRVLGSLLSTVEAAEAIRDRARDTARTIREAAEMQAAALLSQARIEAVEARAVASARVIDRGRRESRALLDEAAGRAERLGSVGRRRLPEVVARVVAQVTAGVLAMGGG